MKQTHQATQPITPVAIRLGILVKVNDQKDKSNQHGDQSTGPHQPPCPPQWLAASEEVQRVVRALLVTQSPSTLDVVDEAGTGAGVFVVVRTSSCTAAYGDIWVTG